MPEPPSGGNATKSTIRARIEYVFAEQKVRMDFYIRTISIGIGRARAAMAYNKKRWHCLNYRRGEITASRGSEWAAQRTFPRKHHHTNQFPEVSNPYR
jgi:hypothetical protein